ncbi:MAG: RNHCP domain-containing protein [Candidatus Daviesbacteria bacterium]
MEGFVCLHCQTFIPTNKFIGTAHRNHCPFCLWSKHVDEKFSGDRKSTCQEIMEPMGLTFKKEGLDKYGKEKVGEIMVIHRCTSCHKISINRIAADDDPEKIMELFKNSQNLDQETKEKIKNSGVNLLTDKDKVEVKTQLFGKNNLN